MACGARRNRVRPHCDSRPASPFGHRFLAAAQAGDYDLILVSHVLFNSGRLFNRIEELAKLAWPDGPWVVIDSYHAFMAIEAPISPAIASSAFVLGGGYKYAMAGEGMGPDVARLRDAAPKRGR